MTSFDWLRESLQGVDHTRKRENNQGSIIINTITGRGWAKYRDFSVASRSIICRDRRLRQIFELRDTDKSRYFAITEFNNCFIIRSPGLFFNEYLLEAKRSFSFPVLTLLTRSGVEIAKWSAIFTQKRSQEGEKRGFIYVEQNIICSQTQLEDSAHKQTIIRRQSFARHVGGSRPIKREKKLRRMIMDLIWSLKLWSLWPAPRVCSKSNAQAQQLPCL